MLFPQGQVGMIFKEIACTLVSKHDLLIRANDLVSHWNK